MKKTKGIIAEFKEFINRGNVMDMAVGVIIGAAFKSIIDSLVNDVIMPVLSLFVGALDFSNLFIALDGNSYPTAAAAKEAGAATLSYGTFITTVINFFLMALVIFFIVKAMNRLTAKLEKNEEKAPAKKTCPYCKSEIAADAVRCPNCTSELG